MLLLLLESRERCLPPPPPPPYISTVPPVFVPPDLIHLCVLLFFTPLLRRPSFRFWIAVWVLSAVPPTPSPNAFFHFCWMSCFSCPPHHLSFSLHHSPLHSGRRQRGRGGHKTRYLVPQCTTYNSQTQQQNSPHTFPSTFLYTVCVCVCVCASIHPSMIHPLFCQRGDEYHPTRT